MSGRIDTSEYQALRSTAMFRSLTPRAAEKILAECVTEIHPAGSRLFRQGEQADCFFLVQDGWVKVMRESTGNQSAVIGVFTRGQTLADAISIAGGVYPASAETVTPARVIRVGADLIRRTIHSEPEIALAMIASTAQHLFLLMQQIEQLKARKSPERVAEFLLSLTDTQAGAASIALPFDKSLIAARLGMQPESLSRAFARLRNVGVMVLGAEVRIEDVAGLNAFIQAEGRLDAAAAH
jgi:CRP-like cAMP-binding protein